MSQEIAKASLDNLHDIIVPDTIGFFPLASGWYIAALLVSTLLFHFSLKAYYSYKKSHYKREALKELPSYVKETKENVIALLALAKRVGIVAYGRKEVASLSDSSWWAFMEKNSKANISIELQKEISKLLYDENYQMPDTLHQSTMNFVSQWIKTHKVEPHV